MSNWGSILLFQFALTKRLVNFERISNITRSINSYLHTHSYSLPNIYIHIYLFIYLLTYLASCLLLLHEMGTGEEGKDYYGLCLSFPLRLPLFIAPFNNARTLLNQRFCFSLPSIIIATLRALQGNCSLITSMGLSYVCGLWLAVVIIIDGRGNKALNFRVRVLLESSSPGLAVKCVPLHGWRDLSRECYVSAAEPRTLW